MSIAQLAVRALPARPSLQHLKKQARALLKQVRAENPTAQQRVKAWHPALSSRLRLDAARFQLADALLVIAREYGFTSYAKLQAFVQAHGQPRPEQQASMRTLPLIDLGDAVLYPHAVLHIASASGVAADALCAALDCGESEVCCVSQPSASSGEPLAPFVEFGALARVELVRAEGPRSYFKLQYLARGKLVRVTSNAALPSCTLCAIGDAELGRAAEDGAVERLYRALRRVAHELAWLPSADLARYERSRDLSNLIGLAASLCSRSLQQSLLAAQDTRAMIDALCIALSARDGWEPLTRKPLTPEPIALGTESEACLVVLYAAGYPHLAGQRYALGAALSIGRADSNTLQLPSSAVSGVHARVECADGRFTLIDLGSSNGTFVADSAQPITRRTLEPGDEIQIGDSILRFLRGPELDSQYAASLDYVAQHDPLTGSKLRAAFHVQTERAVLTARAERRPLSSWCFEVDGLPPLSPSCASLRASALLRRIAAVVRAQLPQHAIIGRIGDAQFAVTVPGWDSAQAMRAAEDLQRACSEALCADSRETRCSLRIGIASLGRTSSVGDLLDAAGEALARARVVGQNAVVGPQAA